MITIYGDCAFRQKDQVGGIGLNYLIDKQQFQEKYYIGHLYDNHIGEFLALYLALEAIESHQANQQVIHYLTDSKIVVASLEKQYVKHSEYQDIFHRILAKLDNFSLFFPKWIPEKENLAADRLARQALLKQGKNIQEISSIQSYFSDQNW